MITQDHRKETQKRCHLHRRTRQNANFSPIKKPVTAARKQLK